MFRIHKGFIIDPKQERSFEHRAHCDSYFAGIYVAKLTRVDSMLDDWHKDIQIAINVFLQRQLNIFVAKRQRKKLIDNGDQAQPTKDIFGEQVRYFPNRVNRAHFSEMQVFELPELALEHTIKDGNG